METVSLTKHWFQKHWEQTATISVKQDNDRKTWVESGRTKAGLRLVTRSALASLPDKTVAPGFTLVARPPTVQLPGPPAHCNQRMWLSTSHLIDLNTQRGFIKAPPSSAGFMKLWEVETKLSAGYPRVKYVEAAQVTRVGGEEECPCGRGVSGQVTKRTSFHAPPSCHIILVSPPQNSRTSLRRVKTGSGPFRSFGSVQADTNPSPARDHAQSTATETSLACVSKRHWRPPPNVIGVHQQTSPI